MGSEHLNQRLSGISTDWTVLRDAHQGSGDAARTARELLVRRYGGAVYRYLQRVLGDPAAAEDLAQEFALGLVRGDFRRADPQRGRFRNYVKTALVHLVGKHRRRQRRLPQPVSRDGAESVPAADDGRFDDDWRSELLARTMDALAASKPSFHAALYLCAHHPKMPSPELAAALSQQLGKPLTAEAARQLLHRARVKFADLLIDAVACSLESPSAEAVVEELRELDLLKYCRAALDRRTRDGP